MCLIVEVCIVTDPRNHCGSCFHVNLGRLRPLSGVRSSLRVQNTCESTRSVPCVQDTCMLSWNPVEFSHSGCLHGSVQGRHVFLLAVAGVIRRMGVSQHRFLLPLDLLLQHGHPALAITQKTFVCLEAVASHPCRCCQKFNATGH